MPRTLTALPWDQHFLPQLVGHLTANCRSAPWDLRNMLVVVPSKESGRRLRQALAERAAEMGTGVLAPEIRTPEQLVNEGLAETTGSQLAVEAAWMELLSEVDLAPYRAVFPTDPPRRDSAWASALATQFASLQADLGEHSLDFRGVAGRVADGEFEPERWAQLCILEGAWRKILTRRGLDDPTISKALHAATASPPKGVVQIAVAGVIDPTPLCVTLLSRWSETVPLEIVTHGPRAEVLVDEWGRPELKKLHNRPLPFGDHSTIHIVRDTNTATAFAARAAKNYQTAPRTFAVGIVDSSLTGKAKIAFAGVDLEAHDPAGKSLGASGTGLLAVLLLRVVSDQRPQGITQIIRHPAFADFAIRNRHWAAAQSVLLDEFDSLLCKHIPTDVDSAVRFSRMPKYSEGLGKALAWIGETRVRLAQRPVAQGLAAVLAEVFEGSVDLSDADRGSVERLGDVIGEIGRLEEHFQSIPTEGLLLLLENAICRARIFPQDSADGWDLQGWLELSFEDAPHLVLVGVNEGHVPETIHGHVFLPNSLRERLEMRGNNERFARDQLILEALLSSRSISGRLDLLVPRMTDDGDPLQPSRLLFSCEDKDLVSRARALFADLPPPPPTAARRAAWALTPLPVTYPSSHSPSSIKAYLTCPFRYYLTHILKARQVEVGLLEISPQVFGDLCHHALQALGEAAEMREIVDQTAIGNFLANAFEARARALLGEADSFALRVQLEAGKARLRAAAMAEAVERTNGWRTIRCEFEWSLAIDGHTIKGRIDRIDRNERTGQYRLIDYKTNDKGRHPEDAHWTRLRDGEAHVLEASVFDRGGIITRWLDLQLPLYLLAMRAEFGSDVGAGYFVLPKTKEETGIRLWTELSPEHLTHAEICVAAVVKAVANGRFWPAATRLPYENPSDYMFPDGIDLDVQADLMRKLQEQQGEQ